jgi:PAS domain S-box-containing protein
LMPSPVSDSSQVRRQPEQKLSPSASLEDLSAACQQLVEGLAVLDADTRVVWANPACGRILGCEPNELLGTSWIANTPGDQRADEERRFGQLRAAALSTFQAVRRPGLNRDGPAPFVERVTIAPGAAPQATRFFCQLESLGESPAVARPARLATLAQIVSGIAHEGRNALQQIAACAEMLAMELEDSPESLDLVAGVMHAEDRLHRLFDDLRAYIAPLPANLRDEEIAQIWRSAWASVARANPRRHIKLVENVTRRDARLHVSANHLEQALMKVFQNAFDSSPDEGAIELSCSSIEYQGCDALALAVHDSGPGFSAKALERLFEPFFSTKTEGLGLGLPIAQRIVEGHGGCIIAVNSPQGGATIEIVLPSDS